MRHSVTTLGYRFRKALDNILYSLNWAHVTATDVIPSLADSAFPNSAAGWLPLYTMVTFRPDISYAAAKRKAERQDRIISDLAWGITAFGCLAIGVAAWKRYSAL